MARHRNEDGFTLIELLVVILIIGILAAIALPAFLSQRQKGQDADAKSNVTNAVRLVESCYIETRDYADCMSSDLAGTDNSGGLSWGTGAGSVDADNPGSDHMRVTAYSHSGGEYTVEHINSATQTRTCTGGACPSDNTW